MVNEWVRRDVMVSVLLLILVSLPVSSRFSGAADPPKELPGLHNVFQATGTVFLGSEPEGEEAFAALRDLGVTTIVSVDGIKPDVETARRFGLRYVHIPIGYDGIPEAAGQQLTRVAREIPGPVYVHCHHGKHRGPAAAAIVCLSSGTLSREQVLALMKRAGTGKDYTGLWRDVTAFVPPAPDARLPQLNEVSNVESLAAAMAKLDRNFDNLRLSAASHWTAPEGRPDLDPVAEALQVSEGLTESLRQLTNAPSDEFREWLTESRTVSEQLLADLRAGDHPAADARIKTLEESCRRCHQVYRNQ